MAFSVNTNVGAMAALQTLNQTSKDMATTQSRINSGFNVASTKDDSAKYTIAQKLRGDVMGFQAVSSSLNNAKSITDVAVSGTEQISDLLNQMKAKALEASDKSQADETRVQTAKDIAALQTQINSVIGSSEFNGVNLLKDGAGAPGSSVSALKDTTGGSTIDVANQGLDKQADVKKVLDVDTTTGFDAAAAKTMIGDIDKAFGAVKTSLSTLGSASRQIDAQLKFTSKLTDAVEAGIGNLVDADMAKESAKLQALQVKQQLGVQALSIANQAPQSIMSLFR